MELRVLRYFLTVAKEGCITRAAERLHVTQPTLSRQLIDLEDELHCKLFDRQYHRLTLTPDGLLLRQRAEEILGLVNKTEADFSSVGERVSGTISLGAGETDAMDEVADVIADLRRQHPGIRFHVHDSNAQHIFDLLDRGLLDFGLILHPADLSPYETLPLRYENTWGLILRKDDPLAQKEAFTYEDLATLPILCSRHESVPILRGKRLSSPDWLADKVPSLNVVGTLNLLYNSLPLVERGVGYLLGIYARSLLESHPTLCFRPVTPPIRSGHSLVWKRGQLFSPAAALFLQHMHEKLNAKGLPTS